MFKKIFSIKIIYFLVIILIYVITSYVLKFISKIDILVSSIITLFWAKDIYIHILSSLMRILVWLSLWVFIWIFLSLIVYKSRYIWEIIKLIIELTRPIPPIAWIPLAILIFWTWNLSAFFIVFLWCFFPIFSSTYFWLSSIPNITKNTCKSFWICWYKYYSKILIPYSLPIILNWIKIWIWTWWMSVIASEIIWANSWLWYFIQISRLMLNIDNIIIWMILIGILWYLLIRSVDFFEKILIPWYFIKNDKN